MTNTFNIYSEISNEKQDVINPLQKENSKYLIHYTIYKEGYLQVRITFGTINRSKYGVRKIEAISSSNIIPVYCAKKKIQKHTK